MPRSEGITTVPGLEPGNGLVNISEEMPRSEGITTNMITATAWCTYPSEEMPRSEGITTTDSSR